MNKSKTIKDFKNFCFRLFKKLEADSIMDSSAVLAYYLTLATIPALISLIAILAYLPTADLQSYIFNVILKNLPGQAGQMILDSINEVLNTKKPSLLSISFITALWATSSGMLAIMQQLNRVNSVQETRSLTNSRAVAVGLTLIYVSLYIFVTLVLIFSSKFNVYILKTLHLSSYSESIISIAKYFISFFLVNFMFSSIYFLAPNAKTRFVMISKGSAISTLVLILSTYIFNIYISNFSNYNQIYGSLGGIIMYMLWLYLYGFILLLGAEIDTLNKDSH